MKVNERSKKHGHLTNQHKRYFLTSKQILLPQLQNVSVTLVYSSLKSRRQQNKFISTTSLFAPQSALMERNLFSVYRSITLTNEINTETASSRTVSVADRSNKEKKKKNIPDGTLPLVMQEEMDGRRTQDGNENDVFGPSRVAWGPADKQ